MHSSPLVYDIKGRNLIVSPLGVPRQELICHRICDKVHVIYVRRTHQWRIHATPHTLTIPPIPKTRWDKLPVIGRECDWRDMINVFYSVTSLYLDSICYWRFPQLLRFDSDLLFKGLLVLQPLEHLFRIYIYLLPDTSWVLSTWYSFRGVVIAIPFHILNYFSLFDRAGGPFDG